MSPQTTPYNAQQEVQSDLYHTDTSPRQNTFSHYRPKRSEGFRYQIALIIVLIALWEGFPFTFIGIDDDSIGCKIVAIISIIGLPIFLIKTFSGKSKISFYHTLSIVFVIWCFIVSFYFNNYVEPKPISQWLPSGYIVLPILLVFLLSATNTTIPDVEKSIVIIGIIGSAIAIIDSYLNIGILYFYHRNASDGDSRIIFCKMPALFAFIISVTKLYNCRSFYQFIIYLLSSIITIYNVVILTESRLSLAGIIISIVMIGIFVLKNSRRFYLIITGIIISVPASIYIIDNFFSKFESFDQYLNSDVSARFRQQEIALFSNVFSGTNGLGFGFMSLNRAYHNTLTFAAYDAGNLVGTGKYGMALTDIGLYSALYQFGYLGIFLVLTYTLLAGVTLIRSRRFGREFSSTAAVGWLFLSLLVSPISINFFTIQFSAHIGALVFFMASECGRRDRPRRVS